MGWGDSGSIKERMLYSYGFRGLAVGLACVPLLPVLSSLTGKAISLPFIPKVMISYFLDIGNYESQKESNSFADAKILF